VKIRVTFNSIEWAENEHRKLKVMLRNENIVLTGDAMFKPGGEFELSSRRMPPPLEFLVTRNGSPALSFKFEMTPPGASAPVQVGTLTKRISIRWDEKAWDRAERMNAVSGYQDYVNDYPNGLKAEEARRRIAAAGESAEDEVWRDARLSPTKATLEAYLRAYPQGRYASEAMARMEELDQQSWQLAKTANTKESYTVYLEQFGVPGPYPAKHLDEARAALAKLGQPVQAVQETSAGTDQLDKQDWDAALLANTPDAFKSYLRNHPNGAYQAEAMARIPLEFTRFERDAANPNLFYIDLAYGASPYQIDSIRINPDFPMQEDLDSIPALLADTLSVPRRYQWGKLIDAQVFAEGRLNITANSMLNVQIFLRDSKGKTLVIPVDAGIAPLKLVNFRIAGDSVVFELSGGVPPYAVEFFQNGVTAGFFELGNKTRFALLRSVDLESLDGGMYLLNFLDSRRTEAVQQDQVELSRRGVPRWLFLLVPLVVILGWLGFTFLRKKRTS
jgi:hypothetical protein